MERVLLYLQYIMITRDYNSLLEHRIFKRTFLQQTEVILNFAPAIDAVSFRNKMLPYLKSVFNLDISDKVDAGANHAEVSSEQEQKKFVFDLNQVKLIIGPRCYKSFAETAAPMISLLIQFIRDVAQVEIVEQIKIVKVNIWPIKSENAFLSFADMISYTFREDCISDMLSYKFGDSPEPVKLSKTSNIVKDGDNLNVILSAEVISKEKVNLGLVLDASTKDVNINDIFFKITVLNDLIYQGFISSISENIVNFMSKEN